jgi:predicted DNA binding CopG/RHH family protein
MKAKPLKQFPTFRSDEEAEEFVANADLSEYDFSQFKPMRFEFAPKDARLNMRLPGSLMQAVKARAEKRGIPYQRFIREALETAVNEPARTTARRKKAG